MSVFVSCIPNADFKGLYSNVFVQQFQFQSSNHLSNFFAMHLGGIPLNLGNSQSFPSLPQTLSIIYRPSREIFAFLLDPRCQSPR